MLTSTSEEPLRPPPGRDLLPPFDGGWLTGSGAREPFISYVTDTNDYEVNWSEELEQLHERSSREHFIDVWTRRAILNQLGDDLPAPATVIDVGCSTGHLLADLRVRMPQAKLIGVDLVAGGLRKAHVQVPDAMLVQADACALPLADESVDALVSANLLEHVPDDRRALAEMFRVLRPGARGVIVVPVGPGSYDYYDRFLGHERRYGRGELAAKARVAGLTVLVDVHLGAPLFPAFWVVKQLNRRRFEHLRGDALEKKVSTDMERTGDSAFGRLACRIEETLLRRGVELPFGIRGMAMVERPRLSTAVNRIGSRVRVPSYGRAIVKDRVSLALFGVLLLAGAFYLWTAGSTYSLGLTGGQADPYNQLASAFLHFHLWIGRAPQALLNLPEPYNPEQNAPYQAGIHDLALYHGKFFLTWGPAPVIVLLVPLHLLGFSPTASLTVSLFAILGLAFALATLRVVLRQIGDVPLWMCVLAGLTLALATAVPFILRRPAVYEEAIAGGYGFAMVAVWLAVTAIANRRASLKRLVLMSLFIGLATASRPTLVFVAVLLIPVFLALQAVVARRDLLIALLVPLGLCLLALLVYDQVRFGSPLENGATYQLAGIDQRTAPFDSFSYVPPGLWFYLMAPPRATTLFPFFILKPPPVSYPGTLSALYVKQLEPTGGLLPMAPIVVFLAALPWLWRRRRASLGPLALPLLLFAGAGVAGLLFLSYVFFSTTERYVVDFSTPLLLGALAAWLAMANDERRRLRRVVRIGGGVLAAWSCMSGLAISFTGYYNLLATTHPGIWRTLENIGSPVSRAVATIEGHPSLAEVSATRLPLLSVGERVSVVIVSPDSRQAVLLANATPAAASAEGLVHTNYPGALRVAGPGRASATYRVPAKGEDVAITVHLNPGLNRLSLTTLSTAAIGVKAGTPPARQFLYVEGISLKGSH